MRKNNSKTAAPRRIIALRSSALTAVLFLTAVLSLPTSALTLGEAQDILFRDNADLAMLRLESERALSQSEEAQAAWFPSLDASANYGFTTETSRLKLDIPFPPPAGTSVERALGDQDKVEFGLDATVPLFTGFSRGHTIGSRQAQARSKEALAQAAHNQLSLRLAALFYGWQLARANALYQAKVSDHAREMQEQLAEFVKAGTAVRSKALAAEARAKAAEVDRLSAENTRDSLALEVLDFLGQGEGQRGGQPNLVPDTTELPPPPWADSLTAAEGSGKRPEERALEESMMQVRLGGKALAGQRLPQLFGMAGVRYANPGLNLAEDEFMSYGLAGLQLKWNLFDGFRNKQQQRQLAIQIRVLQQQRRKLRNEWWKAMQTSRLQYARWTAQLEAARASREAARAAAADLKRQLELGLSTELDLMEARNNEAKADFVVDQAMTLQRLSMLQWQYAAGKEMRF